MIETGACLGAAPLGSGKGCDALTSTPRDRVAGAAAVWFGFPVSLVLTPCVVYALVLRVELVKCIL